MNKRGFVRAKVNRKITPGEMLRTLRELQNLTQQELANRTGLSQSNLSAMENDVRSNRSRQGFRLGEGFARASFGHSLP